MSREVLESLLPPLCIGFGIVTACHFSLTFEGSQAARLFRLAAAPFGLYAFYNFCWRDYVEPDGALYPSVRSCTTFTLLLAHVDHRESGSLSSPSGHSQVLGSPVWWMPAFFLSWIIDPPTT